MSRHGETTKNSRWPALVRLPLFLLAAMAALSFTVLPVDATQMTEQQVRNVCGSSLQSGSAGDKSAMGCEKKCGTKLCTYGCLTENGKQSCEGVVLGLTTGQGGKSTLPGAAGRASAGGAVSPQRTAK